MVYWLLDRTDGEKGKFGTPISKSHWSRASNPSFHWLILWSDHPYGACIVNLWYCEGTKLIKKNVTLNINFSCSKFGDQWGYLILLISFRLETKINDTCSLVPSYIISHYKTYENKQINIPYRISLGNLGFTSLS